MSSTPFVARDMKGSIQLEHGAPKKDPQTEWTPPIDEAKMMLGCDAKFRA